MTRPRSGSSVRLATAERPVLCAGGGVLSARASAELAALAEALELPIAHSLMGKGVVREDHPLLLGMTGFWGTPIANERCRTADLIVAIGTRFAEANSSSWDPRFTFNIPPTRLIPHRRRRRGNRPQSADGARRRRGREARADRARERGPDLHASIAGIAAARDRAGTPGLFRELGRSLQLCAESTRCGPNAF